MPVPATSKRPPLEQLEASARFPGPPGGPPGSAAMARAIAVLGESPTACPLCGAAVPLPLFEKAAKTFFRCGACHFVFVHALWPEFASDTGHLAESYSFGQLREPGRRLQRSIDRNLRRMEAFRPALDEHDQAHAGPSRPQASVRPGDQPGTDPASAPDGAIAGAFAEPVVARSPAEMNEPTGPGRLLEVGCGQGIFLERARAAGWRVEGVDLLPELVALAREQRGLEVHLGELHELELEPDAYDVIFLQQVLEHVVDPLPLLREVHRLLRPGGAAILATGNAESWSARLLGPRWNYYRFQGHMHIRFFGPTSARILAARTGFASAQVHTRGFAFVAGKDLRGRWTKPLVKLAQALVAPFASAAGRGQRLLLVLRK